MQFFNDQTLDFCGVQDVTNTLQCNFILPQPDRSWATWWSAKKKEKEPAEKFNKCRIDMEIVNLNSGESLAKGWGNYSSL
jgi:hypothetical protein